MPVRRAELVVLAPPELPVWFTERHGELLQHSDSTDAHGLRELRWVAHDLPRPPQETAMPRREELAPVVDVSSFKDWDAFSHWWWSFIQKDFVSSPAMQAKVAELTAGKTTELDKVAAIERFVAQEIRYNSWPFGTHGYQPFSAATIFERRFGDCKDKSILLRQMLKEIGVDAVPVLINAEYERASEPLDSAMVGLFNHCIAYVTPTAQRRATTSTRPPTGTRSTTCAPTTRARASCTSPRTVASCTTSPTRRPRPTTCTAAGRSSCAPTAPARSRCTTTATATTGVRLRYRYGGQQGDLQHDLADDLSRTFGAVHVLDAQTSDLEDVGQPAHLDAHFDAPSLWTAEGEARALRVGFDDLGLDRSPPSRPTSAASTSSSTGPTRRTRPWSGACRPARACSSCRRDVDITAPGLLSYTQRARQVEGRLEVQRHFELLVRRVATADYAGFREALQQVRQADQRRLRIAVPPAGEGH